MNKWKQLIQDMIIRRFVRAWRGRPRRQAPERSAPEPPAGILSRLSSSMQASGIRRFGRKALRQQAMWAALGLTLVSFAAVLAIGILVNRFSDPIERKAPAQPQVESKQEDKQPIAVGVYLSREHKIASVPLEQYVRGVVAAEMPIEFEPEALKAQAIAARTYIVRRLVNGDVSGLSSEATSAGAVVTDTVKHQVYATDQQLKARWGKAAYGANMDKISRAVGETQGMIATYRGEPIQAVFFSTSNGYTENSEDYFRDYIPYLRSVPSPWDQAIAPRYKETVVLKATEAYKKLGIPQAIAASAKTSGATVMERTEGRRIKSVRIAGKTFTGREVREKLGLNSSQFNWKLRDGKIEITTYGYGHGIGMSQWGANGMAKEGKTAEQILKHYYTGIAIEQASKLLTPIS